MSKELQEKGVSNNSFYRGISNVLDAVPGFKDSALRAKIHEKYHRYVGDKKMKAGNKEGAEAEYKRADEQRQKALERSPSLDSDYDDGSDYYDDDYDDGDDYDDDYDLKQNKIK